MQKIPQVFISYKRTDEAFAQQLRHHLLARGCRVWMDVHDIPHDANWPAVINDALHDSDIVLGVVTPESVASENVRDEWFFARENKRPLILLRLVPCELPFNYAQLNYIDFAANEFSIAFQSLVAAIDNIHPLPKDSVDFGVRPMHFNRGKSGGSALTPVRTYRPSLTPDHIYFMQRERQFSLTDGDYIESFEQNSATPFAALLLPETRWKAIASVLWQENLVCADWQGQLYAFSCVEQGQRSALLPIKNDATPIHRIVVGQDDTLWAARWNGTLHAIDRDGQNIFGADGVKFPQLPVHLTPLGDGRVALTDQTDTLSVIDRSGGVVWQWQADGAIDEVWAYLDVAAGEADSGFILIIDKVRVMHVRPGIGLVDDVLELPARLCCHADIGEGLMVRRTALVLENQQLLWLSWDPFRFDSGAVNLGRDVSQIVAVHDPSRASYRIALGLDKAGQFFSVENGAVNAFDTDEIRGLGLDPSGRFMFWLLENRVEMYRNPSLHAVGCAVKLHGDPEGALIVGRFELVNIVLKNTGAVPISRLRAKLVGENLIQESTEFVTEDIFEPGDYIQLSFTIQAVAAGVLRLTLEVHMQDEAGPPESHKSLAFMIGASEGGG